MTTASARAVPAVLLRSTLMAAASGAILLALAPQSTAAPNCTGDGTANTCVIDLTNVASEDVDADGAPAAESDIVQFVGPDPLAIDASVFGTDAATTRLTNFELAQVMAGADLTLTGAASATTYSQAWQIDAGGILRARGGNAFGDSALVTVNGTLEIGGGATPADETIGSLAGSGSVQLLNEKILHAGGLGATTPFSGIMSGTGGFDKTGASTTLTLTGDNSYTGATTVTGGILEIGHAGAIDNSSSVTIGFNAMVRSAVGIQFDMGPTTNNGSLEGNVDINGTLTAGPSSILRPGEHSGTTPDATGIINIFGDYAASTASAAFFDMEIDLDAALPANGTLGGTHDYVNIEGNATGGTTRVFFTEMDVGEETGLLTTGNGIQIIRVTGTTTPGAFVQGNALNAGAYQYLLTYVQDYSATDDGYFLQSAVRDEIVVQPALLSAGQAMIRSCFRDDQRVPDSPKNATFGRAWFGYHQGTTEFGPDTGVDMDLDYSCTNGGMDWRMGYGWFGGVAGGFGSANGDVLAPAGVGNLDGDARVIEAYAAFTSSSFFINLSAGYADMDWAYTGAVLATQQTSVSGFIASAQAGLALDLDLVAVKLIGAVNYDDTNCGDSCFGFAVTEDTGLIEGKGTVRFDGVTWGGSIRPWASVSYSDVLSDGVNAVSLGAVSASSAPNDELLSIDAGLQTYLDENFALFADGGYHESLSKDVSGYKGGVGLKLYW